MKNFNWFALVVFFLFSLLSFSQPQNPPKKVVVSGKILEKSSSLALEYATVTFINLKNSKLIFGGITNDKGEYSIEVFPGNYNIKFEFISFKPFEIKSKQITENTVLPDSKLEEDATQLKDVVVQAEKSSVDIRLDKKIFNVGKDMTVKGGTASDVLNNVPSVTVDSDGNVSLRGNENVKILIDGRPTSALNIADALKNISADALDKVEVITNPSARYDAEGGAGILNIVLKKGKTDGTNGSVTATVGEPENYGLLVNLNHKTEAFNFFSNFGYNNSKSPSKNKNNSDYLDANGDVYKSINEVIDRERGRKGINFNFGLDWYLTPSLTWTNAIDYRTTNSLNPENSTLNNYEPNNNFIQYRFNDQSTYRQNAEYTTNFTKKFKKDGHKLTIDGAFSGNTDNDSSFITNTYSGLVSTTPKQSTKNLENEQNNLIQTDYVLPLGKESQFEAGYRGVFNNVITDFNISNQDANGEFIADPNYTNLFDYKEKIQAVYTQFGSKINKFSYLAGLRVEHSDIDIDLLTTNNLTNKKYTNYFPSAFLNYQLTEITSFSLNYSRRINRPRSRFINPFPNFTSNVNIFQGNPDINPSLTNVFELSYLTKWDKLMLTSTVYFNKTSDAFQFVRRPNGNFAVSVVDAPDTVVDGVVTQINGGEDIRTPIVLATPINLANEDRFGLEFNANYSPFKIWRLNANFNFFQSKTTGSYSYLEPVSNQIVNESLNNNALGWFIKLNSKVSLPYKIDFQSNMQYFAPQNVAQGKMKSMYSINLALAKDLLKDKATLSLNVSDLLNSNKRRFETNLPTLNSYSEFQWRSRQINLSFTYRFNKPKEKAKPQGKPQDDGGGEF